ncbi:MAG: hypothetical protein ACT4RN_07045 [Pseudonocardia sp.]
MAGLRWGTATQVPREPGQPPGFGVFFAALALWAQPRDAGWGVPIGLLAFGVAFGSLAYLLDSGLAETTLFEVDARGPAGVQEFRVDVEHPGVEHELLVAPRIDELADVPGPVDLDIRVAAADGTSLLATPLLLGVDCASREYFCGWESWYGTFTPRAAGAHVLRVEVRTPDVDVVHLRVEDPEKTDGVRAPGY